MSNRGRRPRSRKRRVRAAPATTVAAIEQSHTHEREESKRSVRASTQTPVSRRYGERPRPAWHPLPLSELLILVGAIGVLVGLGKGLSHGGPPLLAGIAAVALGTLEVTLREHRSGYRSHTIMLAALPVVIFHSVVVLATSAFTRVPAVVNAGLFALDLLLFLAMFRLLRSNFLTARTRAAGRS